jgi:hypothetical protein
MSKKPPKKSPIPTFPKPTHLFIIVNIKGLGCPVYLEIIL